MSAGGNPRVQTAPRQWLAHGAMSIVGAAAAVRVPTWATNKTLPADQTVFEDAVTKQLFITLKNNNASGGDTIYVGVATVNATNGYPLLPGEEKEFVYTRDFKCYVFSAGNSDLRYIIDAY